MLGRHHRSKRRQNNNELRCSDSQRISVCGIAAMQAMQAMQDEHERDWVPMEDEHENVGDGVGRLRPNASAHAECREFEPRADSRVSLATAPAAGYFPAP